MRFLAFRATFVALLSTVLVGLGLYSGLAQAVSKGELERVRSRNVLTDQDLQILDDFVAERFAFMEAVSEVSELSNPMRELLEGATSKVALAQTQQLYARRYRAAIKANYKRLYEKGTIPAEKASSADKELAYHKRLAVAVILATVADAEVIEDLVALLGDASSQVRYWAAKGLASDVIYDYLVAAESSDTAVQALWDGLRSCLEKEQSGAVLVQIATTALVPKHQGSIELLEMCVKKRQGKYQSWQVDNESTDLELLKLILQAAREDMLGQSEQERSALIRAAVDLFSVAFHRYYKGMTYTDSQGKKIVLLSPSSKAQLETLLIEGEQALLRVAESPRRGAILPALVRDRWQDLEKAHNTLLAPEGILDRALEIYQGENDGPTSLADPTAEVVERAITLAQIQNKVIGGDQY